MEILTPRAPTTPANDVDPPPHLAHPADRRILERARLYDAWRAVYDGELRGDTLRARCEGSLGEAWLVRVTLGSSPPRAACTCPVGEAGGCKHVAAVMLAWRRDPSAFQPAPTLSELVHALDAAALRGVLLDLARRSDEMEALVTAMVAGPPVARAPTGWGERVGRLFREHAHCADAGAQLAAALDALLDEHTVDEDPQLAAARYVATLRGVLGRARRLGDGAAPLRPVVRRCIDGVAGSCPRIPSASARREALWALVDLVSFDLDRGVAAHASAPGRLAVQRVVEHASPDDREWLAARVRARIDEAEPWAVRAWSAALAALTEGAMDDERWLDLCREHQLHAFMARRLIRLGRVDEALRAAALVGDGALLDLADPFAGAGRHDEFSALVRARLSRCAEAHRARFAAWLTANAEARRDELAALEVAEQLLLARPSSESLAHLRALATRAGRWHDVRARVYPLLEASAQPALAEALVLDGELSRAVEFVTSPRARTPAFGRAREALLARLEASDPRAAARVLHAQAQGLIALRSRAGYSGACTALARAQRLLTEVGEAATAALWIDLLRERHANLPALMQLLDLHFGEPTRAAG